MGTSSPPLIPTGLDFGLKRSESDDAILSSTMIVDGKQYTTLEINIHIHTCQKIAEKT